MSQHPEKNLTADDIPAAVSGARIYSVCRRASSGYDVLSEKIGVPGFTFVDHKSSEQSALRVAIRYQKRANAEATKRRKGKA